MPAGDRIVNQGAVNMKDPVGDSLHHQGLAQSSSARQPFQIRMEFCRPTAPPLPPTGGRAHYGLPTGVASLAASGERSESLLGEVDVDLSAQKPSESDGSV